MMTQYEHIARPYAKAAFTIAKNTDSISLWSQVLRQLAYAAQDQVMQSLLKNPNIIRSQWDELMIGFLHEVYGNGSVDCEEKMANFVKLLIEQKRLPVLSAIATMFQALVAEHKGYLQLTVISAFALDNHKKKTIQSMLKLRFKSDVVAEFAVNSDLIGGLLVRAGHRVLDDSVRGKLERLKSVMIV